MVLENSAPDELIVIKSSPLYADESGVISEFHDGLLKNGRSVIYSKDFCRSLGIDEMIGELSSEDLFYLGVLDDAANHDVLDGSLASIIASHPRIERPTRLVLGGKININDSVGLSNFINNLAGQMHGLMEFSEFSLTNAEQVRSGHFPALVTLGKLKLRTPS